MTIASSKCRQRCCDKLCGLRRSLRAEAREAVKLMQDKRFLESKVAEMTGTLELVQNQRNELKQSYKVSVASMAVA
jgi:hypothetical protein